MKAKNILWGIDTGDNIVLPNEIDIPEYLSDEDKISDYLSDITGYCHKGFELNGRTLKHPPLRSPCDLCMYNPPSSMDGKPCGICPAYAISR